MANFTQAPIAVVSVKSLEDGGTLRSNDVATIKDALQASNVKTGLLLKRAIDLIGALIALVMLLPLMLLVAAVIKVTSPGPVLFAHRRLGKDGKAFHCLKFRSMVANSAEVLAQHLEENPEARAEWVRDHKLLDDPRISGVGKFLRRSSLDELPQLINVLFGEMSLVGPRPIVTDEVAKYGRYINYYTSVTPGITGLWQISGRNDMSYRRRVAIDTSYVRNHSIGLDFAILLRTLPAVLQARGAGGGWGNVQAVERRINRQDQTVERRVRWKNKVSNGVREPLRDPLGGVRNVVAIRSDDPLITQAVADIVSRVTEIVGARREAISQQNIDSLVDAYLKSESIAPVRHTLELDNARERARFTEEHICFSSKEVAQLAGHGAANASATGTRWKKAGRIFSLPWKDGDLFPAFQFADGQPRPVIQRLLAIFSDKRTPWQIAFWLTSTNSWLDGAAPVEQLDDQDAVVAAAENEIGVVFG